jgi:chromosome segregation and condensation protein ScpB
MSGELFYYIAVAIIGLMLYYILTQWVHQVQKRNRYARAQIELLAKIAERQGVSKDDIEGILESSAKPEKPMGLK